MHLFLVASCYYYSKALVITSVALVTTSKHKEFGFKAANQSPKLEDHSTQTGFHTASLPCQSITVYWKDHSSE